MRKTSDERTLVRSLRCGVALFVAMLFWPAFASAQVEFFGLSLPAGEHPLQQAIDSLKPDGGFINVTGTCENPIGTDGDGNDIYQPFLIEGFTGRLNISGGTLSQPVVACDTDPSTVSPTRPNEVLIIENSNNVRLSDLTITGGEGVFVDNSDVRFRGGVIVEQSLRNGILVGGEGGGALRLFTTVGTPVNNEVTNNCRAGITVGRGSFARASEAWIHVNKGFGLQAFESGRVTVNRTARVFGNVRGGIRGSFGAFVSVGGQAVIEGNGDNPNTDSVFFRYHSGVSAYFGTQVLIRGPIDVNTGLPLDDGPRIVDNIGPGVLVDLNSNVRLENATVQLNSEGGLKLLHESVAELGPAAPTTLSGNGFGDLDCDQSSLAFGDLSGVANNRCQRAPEPRGPGTGAWRKLIRERFVRFCIAGRFVRTLTLKPVKSL